MNIPPRIETILWDNVGNHDFVAYIQSWWSGHSNDMIIVCRNGSVYCRAEGEVCVGVPSVKYEKRYQRDKSACEDFIDSMEHDFSVCKSQDTPLVLSNYSSVYVYRKSGRVIVINVADGVPEDDYLIAMEEKVHSFVPELVRFYKRESR